MKKSDFPHSFISFKDSNQITHKVYKIKGNETFEQVFNQNPLKELRAVIHWEDSLIEQISITTNIEYYRFTFSAEIPHFNYSLDHFTDKVGLHLNSFMNWFQLDEFELKFTGYDSLNQVKINSRGENLYQLDFKLNLEVSMWKEKAIHEFWQAIDQINHWVIAHSKTSDLLKKPRPDAGAAPLPIPTPIEPPVKPLNPSHSIKPRSKSLTIPFTEIPESPMRFHVKRITQTMLNKKWILFSKSTVGVMYPNAPQDGVNYIFNAHFFIEDSEKPDLLKLRSIHTNDTYNLSINYAVLSKLNLRSDDFLVIEKLDPPYYRMSNYKPGTLEYLHITKNLNYGREGMTATNPTQF
jgi:hypothetical protein